MVELSGRVIKQIIGKGTKSEHDAVLLETKDGNYVLRRRGGNPFRDPELDALVGQRIRANGVLTAYTFVMTDWAVESEA